MSLEHGAEFNNSPNENINVHNWEIKIKFMSEMHFYIKWNFRFIRVNFRNCCLELISVIAIIISEKMQYNFGLFSFTF